MTEPAEASPTAPVTAPAPADFHLSTVLPASGPRKAHARGLNGFGQLVGTWRVHSSRLSDDRADRVESEFIWVVEWVLDGWAVQDAAVVMHDDTYKTLSTALRVYDRVMGAWRVSYFEPERGEYCHLVASDYRGGVRQDGTRNDDRLIRWNFTEITRERYTWEGWVSDDEGATWWLQEHNEGERIR